jgi:hypothetical protein
MRLRLWPIFRPAGQGRSPAQVRQACLPLACLGQSPPAHQQRTANYNRTNKRMKLERIAALLLARSLIRNRRRNTTPAPIIIKLLFAAFLCAILWALLRHVWVSAYDMR